MMVNATQLLSAAEQLEASGEAQRAMTNGVVVTPAQLRKAGEILRDGPQSVANGIKSDMPGFIHRDQQKDGVLVFQVGILPSRTYEIDAAGEVAGDA